MHEDETSDTDEKETTGDYGRKGVCTGEKSGDTAEEKWLGYCAEGG